MRDACKEIPDLVQNLVGEMQKLQISQARLEDNVQTLTNRVDNVEIDARKSIDAYLEVQAQKVEKELNEWLEIKDREISAKIESDVKTAVEQATAAASCREGNCDPEITGKNQEVPANICNTRSSANKITNASCSKCNTNDSSSSITTTNNHNNNNNKNNDNNNNRRNSSDNLYQQQKNHQ
ncbi:bromodomain-containing protein DDB_G0270170-like [Schistocerca nitens]|uniref:bromodomain-containing protein DDB_G0270170-like n=1 Tax=Schistocerca nitens TaxID=7011 RepID=UPI002119736C|nr:bromodomain-containing protein DDB_G0270170-like [Schistocerca nitens]